MTEWEKSLEEQFPVLLKFIREEYSFRNADRHLVAFITQTHIDLVEAILGDVERSKNWDKVEPNFDLPNYLRAKYLNNK